MGALALGLVLITGYYFQHKHPIRRVELARSSGYHIYFKAGFSGFVLLCTSVFVWLIIDFCDLPSTILEKHFYHQPLTFLKKVENWDEVKAVIVFILMFLSAFIYCCYQRFMYSNSKAQYLRRIQKIAHELEKLIISATVSVSPVRLELESGKVYVGIPKSPDLDTGELRYISLIPLLSGYVDEDRTLVFNNNYYRHYEMHLNHEDASGRSGDGHSKIDDFVVVVPVEQIVVSSLFSIDAFIKFRSDRCSELLGRKVNKRSNINRSIRPNRKRNV